MVEVRDSKSSLALVPWGDVWDDYLDSIGVSLEDFCHGGCGGWLLGYLQALRAAGVRGLVILVSARVDAPLRIRNDESGVDFTVLPAPRSLRAIRSRMANPNPYLATSFEEMVGDSPGNRGVTKLLSLIGPYVATPLALLAREIRREQCAAILCQDYESPRFDSCTFLGKLVGLPVFGCFQGGNFDASPIGRFIRPVTMRVCNGVVVGPRAEAERVLRRYRLESKRVAQIFNPVDLGFWRAIDRREARESLGLSPEVQVVLWHGRIDMRSKRLDVLLDSWQQICADRGERNLQLLLLGMGEDAELLRGRIATLKARNVRWADRYASDRVEVRRFLSAGDVYAFPSAFEGFPVAPIEAMACGLPVVAAAASGVPEILEDGEASGGLMVPCGDVAAFTSALRRVLNHPDWSRELGARARRRVEAAFSVEAVGSRLVEFLSKRR